ncbi:MAG: hypothetical protein HWD59_03735 [Coxiellaceae bacterium]|nr:MAG: hypothetical protein HWD59_03735 [Coxiellaceae bacterium]
MKEVRSDLCPQLEILLKQGHIINNDFCNAILMVCDWIHHAEIQDKFLLKLLDLAILWTYHPKNNHDLVMRQKEMILMRHIIQAVKGLHYNESVCNKIANYLLNKQNGCLFYLNIFGLPVEGKDNFIRDALSQFRTFLSPDGYVLAAELGGELVKMALILIESCLITYHVFGDLCLIIYISHYLVTKKYQYSFYLLKAP